MSCSTTNFSISHCKELYHGQDIQVHLNQGMTLPSVLYSTLEPQEFFIGLDGASSEEDCSTDQSAETFLPSYKAEGAGLAHPGEEGAPRETLKQPFNLKGCWRRTLYQGG